MPRERGGDTGLGESENLIASREGLDFFLRGGTWLFRHPRRRRSGRNIQSAGIESIEVIIIVDG